MSIGFSTIQRPARRTPPVARGARRAGDPARRHAPEICAAAGSPATLIELGSGSAEKTRALLDAMGDAGCLEAYAPVDISEWITRRTAEAIESEYRITVHGLVCDFERDLERMPLGGPRVIALLGGTIGKLRAGAARELSGASREPPG